MDLWQQLLALNVNKQFQTGEPRFEEGIFFQKLSPALLEGDSDGSIFDHIRSQYESLRDRLDAAIGKHIVAELNSELRPYTRISLWSSIGTISDSLATDYSKHMVTPDFVPVLSLMENFLKFLSHALSHRMLQSIFTRVAAEFTKYLWEWVITTNKFTYSGAKRLSFDVLKTIEMCNTYVAPAQALFKRLCDTCVILSLPNSEEDAKESTLTLHQARQIALMGVTPVESQRGEEQAAQLFKEKLGITALPMAEVRGILQRRHEYWQ